MNNLLSITEARNNLPTLIDQVNEFSERVVITVNGQPKATLISAEELEALEETSEILAIPNIRKDILQGLKEAKAGKGKSFSKILK